MQNTSLKKIAIKDVATAIIEDLGTGDITTDLLGKDKNKLTVALVKTNQEAILCGKIWFDNAFKNIQKKYRGPLKITWYKKDGDKIKNGETICKIVATILQIVSPFFILSPSFLYHVIFNGPRYFFCIFLNALSNHIFPHNMASWFVFTNATVNLFLSLPSKSVVMSPVPKSSIIAVATSFIAIFFRLVFCTLLFPYKVFF